jgi:hypothetical protein
LFDGQLNRVWPEIKHGHLKKFYKTHAVLIIIRYNGIKKPGCTEAAWLESGT